MKNKIFMLLIFAISIISFSINVKADVAMCYGQLNGYVNKVGVGEEFTYDVGTMGVPSNVYVNDINYKIEYWNEVLEVVPVNGKLAGAYNGWTVEVEHDVNPNIAVNTITIHAHTDDKTKMYNEISLAEFVKMAYVKFKVKATKPTSTSISIWNTESHYDVLFEDGEVRQQECGPVDTAISIYAKDNNTTLSSLKIDKGDLNPKFNSNTFNYDVTVENNVDLVQIDASCAGKNCKLTGTGLKKLSVGENKFTITVKSEQGNTKDYTLRVIRKIKDEVYLKELTVKNGNLYPSFNSNIINYVIDVPNNVNKLDLEYISNNEQENTVEVVGNENLKVGKNNIEITVKNESKKIELTYEIVVNKLEKKEEPKVIDEKEDSSSDIFKILTVTFGFLTLVELIAIIVIISKKNKAKIS